MSIMTKTADLYDIYEEKLQVCDPVFRHFGGRRSFHGRIATLKCFEDNSLVSVQLGLPGEGRVLVVDAGGSLRCAMLGDQLAQKAVDNGWAFGPLLASVAIHFNPSDYVALMVFTFTCLASLVGKNPVKTLQVAE